MTEKEQILQRLQKLDKEAFLNSVEEAKAKTIQMLMARKERYTPGRIAFNIVNGVDRDSDDFDFQSPAQQAAWEEAVKAAEDHRKNNCTICGHPWVDHEMGVPAPYCP